MNKDYLSVVSGKLDERELWNTRMGTKTGYSFA